jgi:DNA/RNA-binding domain of Phe-tRNA-synthetase-like protein
MLLCAGVIRGVKVEQTNAQVEALRRTVTEEVRGKYRLELLKDNPTIRAYRDLFWSLGVDPTKTRPSGEALLRRVLHGREIPRISTVVDSYNLAS